MIEEPSVLLVTGISASGKSTVGQLLAERLGGAHVRGDVFRRMIVPERRAHGRRPVQVRVEMTPDLDPEAVRQLELRYRIAAMVADSYFDAGFRVVVQDVIVGVHLERYVASIRSRPLYVTVLIARPKVIAAREADRGKTGFGHWSIEALDEVLCTQTPRIGLWLDNSDQTPDETVDEILKRLDEARV